MFMESLFNSRQFKDVPAAADRVLKFDANHANALRFKARAFFELKQYPAAIDGFLAVEKADTLIDEDFRKLGRAYQETGKDSLAARAYERSLALDSNQTNVMNDAGTLYMKMKRWEDAARLFEKRYQLDSTAVGAYINYANCMLALEKFDNAAGALEQAIRRNPDYVPAYTRLGIAYLQMKDYPKARSTFELAVKVIDTSVTKYKSDLAQAYRYIGLAQLLDKQWNDAIASLRKSLDIEPKDESTLLWTAQGLQNAQKKDEAIKFYKEVLKVNKTNEQAKKGLEVLEAK
jgi:tetratricopeptide (TPR) repeat protein